MAEKGKVKWFSNVKGYGFLSKEGGDKDIFVHYASIQGEGYKTLKPDEEVTFEVVEGQKGPQATNVVRVNKAAKAGAAPAAEKKEAPQEAPKAEK